MHHSLHSPNHPDTLDRLARRRAGAKLGWLLHACVYLTVQLALAGLALDDAWTDLVAEDDGIIRTVLSSPTGSTMTLEQRTATETPGVGVVQVFTGEGLVHRARESVALEPCQLMTDAFNRDEGVQEVPLAPGATRLLDAALIYRV